MDNDTENLKLSHQISWKATDDEMLFFQQIGLRWAQMHWGTEPPDRDEISAFQQRLRRYDIQIYSGRHDAYHSKRIQLGQPGRDEDIEIYCDFVRILGELGIPVSVYDFHPGNTYSTGRVVRRGYSARVFNLDDFRTKVEEQRYDRDYTTEEIWENYTYFVNAVLPVAESSNVMLALHPDDPPVETMNGVGKMITHYDGYRRAEEIAEGSAHWGAFNNEFRVFLIVGVLGSFTTFSAFSMDVGMLINRNELFSAGLYILTSTVLSIGAYFLAMMLFRQLFQ